MATFLQSLTTVIQRAHLILPGSIIVVGVSGGADSLALLHALNQLSPSNDGPSLDFRLHAATLDHQLRGQAAVDDARFVQEIAQAWKIPVTTGQVDVKALAVRLNLGIEAAARLARYDFLAGVAHEVGARQIAVAHHADDQAETILLHILRGAGTRGLGGIALKSPLSSDLTLIRPFLHFPKAEIAAYCRENDLHPRHDASNDDPAYLRNRIRLQTLPYLETINPQIDRALTHLADIAAVEQDYMDEQFQRLVLEPHARLVDGQVAIRREVFRALHPAFQRRFVAWAVEQIGQPGGDTGFHHIVAAVEIGLNSRQGAKAQLSGGLCLRVDYDLLVIEPEDTPVKTDMPLLSADTEIRLTVPGVTLLPASWQLEVSLEPINEALAGRLAVPVGSELRLRTRQPGDRFAPLGLHGHSQKLHKWLIDHKVPAALRDQIPLIIVNGDIAAFMTPGGWIVDERFAVHESTTHIIYAAFRENPQDC